MKKCIYSNDCGACSLQGISYNKQLKIKQDKINSLLNRFSKVEPILGMDNPLNYRNKVQVSFAYDDNHNVVYGNYEASKHFIVPFDDCMINDETSNEIIKSTTRLINKYKISIFDENSLRGCIRHLLIRSTNTGEYMLVLVTGSTSINKKEQFINDIVKYNKEVVTIVQNINNKHTSMVLGNKNIVLYGKGFVTDKLCGLKFNISANSFYQVNKRQTEVLYNKVIELAKLNKDDVLLDAYCGTGTIGLVTSKYCKQVYGVEINKDAVKDAINNAKNNKIKNCYFINEDASEFMYQLSKNDDHIEVLIMDPPRTGSNRKFLENVLKVAPNRIVYVSCGPDTLVRDLDILTRSYKVETIQPIDMFPFTDHIECIVSMHRNISTNAYN